MAITNSPRLGIERWSHGTDRHPPRAVWDAQQAILDDLVAIDRQYATLADRPAAGVRGTYCWVEENGVLYRDDGAQWRPIVQFGGGAGAAVVVGGSGSEGTSARTARADHSHPLPLVTSSAHGAMRKEDKALLDAATHISNASAIVRRSSDNSVAVRTIYGLADPTGADHATRKGYVDDLVGGVHVPTAIPSGANLDAYTTSGVYLQNQHTAAQAGTNYPVPYAGLLTVHASSALVFQEYTATNLNPGLDRNAAWRRTRYNGSWGAWEQSPTARYVDEAAGAARFAGHLDGIDLDEVLDPGLYGLNAQANATTALNYPAEGIGGTLLVMRWAGASGDSRAVTQLYQGRGARSRNIVWIRSKIAATSAFSPWVELANTDLATSSSDGLMSAADKVRLAGRTEADPGSLVARTSQGSTTLATLWLNNAPTTSSSATRKDYVDAGDAAAQSGAEATAAAALAPVKALTDTATANATGNALMRRDSSGRVSVTTPTSTSHAATKGYVDSGDASAQSAAEATAAAALAPVKTTVDNATANATANRLVLRDSAGRFKAAAPSATTDVANRAYVDAGDQALNSLFGELDDRTFDMQATLDLLSYKSGARRQTTANVITVSGSVTVSRVGYVVTVVFHDFTGSTASTGGSGFLTVPGTSALPAEFRPPAALVSDNRKFQLTAGGNAQHSYPGSMSGYGATFTYVVTADPPASFTWGTAV